MSRQDIIKKYKEKKKQEKIKHEYESGMSILGEHVRLSDFVKNKLLSGKTQVLVIDGKIVQFHKDTVTGYWVNNTRMLRLHREKLRLHLGLTNEQMQGLDVHHIDGNKDNNELSNLQLLKKTTHAKSHADKQIINKIIKVCEQCGKEYESSSNIAHRQRFCSNKCKAKWRRDNGMNNTIRICKNCGKEFICDNTSRKIFCTRNCAGKYNYHKSLKQNTTNL